jgi:hypothetical protein
MDHTGGGGSGASGAGAAQLDQADAARLSCRRARGRRVPDSLDPHSALKLSNSIASRRRSVMVMIFGPCFEMFMLSADVTALFP